MMPQWILFLLGCGAMALALRLLFRRRRQRPSPPSLIALPQALTLTPWKATSTQKQQLLQARSFLQAQGVERVVLIHGTFVGQDPYGLINWIEERLPRSTSLHFARRLTTQLQGVLVQERGLFSARYQQLLAHGLGPAIHVERFFWSSENHLWGRLQGSLELARKAHQWRGEKTLLIAHSHGAQLPILLGQILTAGPLRERLQKELKSPLPFPQDFNFIVYTLGAPVRYHLPSEIPWPFLHLVAHRGPVDAPLSPWQALGTRQGDMIQHWGGPGSDRRDARSTQWGPWVKGIDLGATPQRRQHPFGTTVWASFGQHSWRPNAGETLFGHSFYTSRAALIPLLQILEQHWPAP